jgi:hypothetical protein
MTKILGTQSLFKRKALCPEFFRIVSQEFQGEQAAMAISGQLTLADPRG